MLKTRHLQAKDAGRQAVRLTVPGAAIRWTDAGMGGNVLFKAGEAEEAPLWSLPDILVQGIHAQDVGTTAEPTVFVTSGSTTAAPIVAPAPPVVLQPVPVPQPGVVSQAAPSPKPAAMQQPGAAAPAQSASAPAAPVPAATAAAAPVVVAPPVTAPQVQNAAANAKNITDFLSSNQPTTPIGEIMGVLCGALFVIFLPAVYVTVQGKNKPRGGGNAGEASVDDYNRPSREH